MIGEVSNHRIDAVFEGRGSVEPTNDGLTLTQQLQYLFDANDAGMQVKSASVSWDESSTGQPVDENSRVPVSQFVIVVIGILLVAVLYYILLFLGCALYRRKSGLNKIVLQHDMWATKQVDPEKAVESKDEVKVFEDDEVISVSTAPPPSSDGEGCSDTGSVI